MPFSFLCEQLAADDKAEEDDCATLDGRFKIFAIVYVLLFAVCSLESAPDEEDDNSPDPLFFLNKRLIELREGTLSLLQISSCTRRSRISHEYNPGCCCE